MVFNSLTFVLFFLVVVSCHHAPLPWPVKKLNLLIFSYLFYAAWNPPFILLLWASTIVDWWMAKLIYREDRPAQRKRLLVVSLALNLGMLSYFKYGAFALKNWQALMASVGVAYTPPAWDIVLPIGISFYTFVTLSYTLDVYLKRAKPGNSFLDFALFVTYFPHLVAGPIVRPIDLIPQFAQPRVASRALFLWGLALITLGLFQKVVVADTLLAPVANDVFGAANPLPPLDAWAGVIAFRGPDLRRLRRLLDLCDRRLAVSRLLAAGQFPLPVCCDRLLRFLAALAHLPVDLAARLSVHSPRRQPQRPLADLPQSDDHHAARRAVARSQLDLRCLGRAPRHLSLGRTLRAQPLRVAERAVGPRHRG